MNTLELYELNKQAQERGDEIKFMDFKELFRIIHMLKPDTVRIGLKDDEEWTAGNIISDGEWCDDYYFVHSYVCTPFAEVDYKEIFELETSEQQLPQEAYENDVLTIKRYYEEMTGDKL